MRPTRPAGRRRTMPLGTELLEGRQLLSNLPTPLAARPVAAPEAVAVLDRLGPAVGEREAGPFTFTGTDRWFQFRTLGPGRSTHRVALHSDADAGRLTLELYDASGRLLGRSGDGRGYDEIGLQGRRAGAYRLRVVGPADAGPSRFSLSFHAPGARVAGDGLGNHTPGRAVGLGPLGRIVERAGLTLDGRPDWFRFRVGRATPSGGTVALSFRHADGDVDLALYRWAGRGRGLEYVARSSGMSDVERLDLAGLRPGIYFVQAYGHAGGRSPAYTLRLDPAGILPAPAAASSTARPEAIRPATAAATGDWYDQNLPDAALGNAFRQAMQDDGQVTRTDMLAIFAAAGEDATVTAAELQSLQAAVANTSVIVMPDAVRNLAGKTVNANAANAMYQGQPLGDLAVGSTGDQLQDLVNKWFLGLDHPLSAPSKGGHVYAYAQAAGTLFGSTVSYTDVQQGDAGDCYLMSSLAELALHDPSFVDGGLIAANGDGTYTVRFYADEGGQAQADYVTVDGSFPVDANGYFVFANNNLLVSDATAVLWVPLVEKAYAQWSAEGLNGQLSKSERVNAYWTIGDGGYADKTLEQLTGEFDYVDQDVTSSLTFAFIAGLFDSGSYVVLGSDSGNTLPDPDVVDNHDYALVGYDAAAQTVRLFNPWGVAGGYEGDRNMPGYVDLTIAEIVANYSDIYHRGPA